jgi:hypothetical protein
MFALFAVLNHLLPTLQKTAPFREKQPHSASKPHPKPLRKPTMWVSVVPIPFCRCCGPSAVLHPSSLPFSATPGQIISCGGLWGYISENCPHRKGKNASIQHNLSLNHLRRDEYNQPLCRRPSSVVHRPSSIVHPFT